MVCKRQEQCKFGKMCGWAKDEETLLTECVEFIERVPLTNKEWFDSLTTEEKAEWITDKINAKLRMALHDAELYDGDVNENEYMENEDEWVEWLKKPHTVKE